MPDARTETQQVKQLKAHGYDVAIGLMIAGVVLALVSVGLTV